MRDFFSTDEAPTQALTSDETPASSSDLPQKNFFAGLPQTPETQNRDWFDVTVGAVEHGAADTAALLSRSLNRQLMGGQETSGLEEFSRSMEKFKKDNPQYSPVEVENTLELLGNPKAMASRIFGSAAYTAMMIGSNAIPSGGWLASGLAAYGVESQRAYESAKQFGATEQEAETAGRYTGLTNAMFQVGMSTKMFHVLKGEEGVLAGMANRSTNSIIRSLGPSADLVKDAGVLGTINAIQGAVDEKIALDTYGKPYDKDYWDRRFQEGSIGAATTMLMGGPRTALKTLRAINAPDGTQMGTSELNVFDRQSAKRFFQNSGVPDDHANSLASLADVFANQFAADTGFPKERFFSEVVNNKNFEPNVSNGQMLQGKMSSLLNSFSQDPASTIKTFLKTSIDQFSGDKVAELQKSLGVENSSPAEADVKMEKAFLRYLWNAESPSPEAVAPMEDLKQLLRDTYKNVSTLDAPKIPLETKLIFDSMLAPETDEITAARRRVEGVKQAMENIPTTRDLLTEEDIQKILEPQVETKKRYEFDPHLNVTKEIIEHTPRKPSRDEIRQKMEEILSARTPPAEEGATPASEPLGMVEGVPQTKNEGMLLLKDLENDLDRLRLGRTIAEDRSGVEKRSDNGSWLRDRLLMESPLDTRDRSRIEQVIDKSVQKFNDYIGDPAAQKLDAARSLFDQRAPLRRWKSGQTLLDAADEHKTQTALTHQEFERKAVEASTSLTWKERNWLRVKDEQGYTNAEKMLDQSISRPMEIPKSFSNVKNFRDSYWLMNQEYGRRATNQGQLMRFSDGKWAPYAQPDAHRMLRLHTDEFRQAMQNPQGSLFEAIMKTAIRDNPDLAKMNVEKLKKHLDQAFNDSEMRTNSALESARLFKNLPSWIQDGTRLGVQKWVKIFETEPYELFSRSSKIQASRLAFGKLIGQQVVDTIGKSKVRSIAKEFGVEPVDSREALVSRIRERLLETKDPQELYQNKTNKGEVEGPANSVSGILSNLHESLQKVETEGHALEVLDPLSQSKAMTQAVNLAREMGINLRPSRQEYLNKINQITATNMNAKQKGALIRIGKSLEGVDTRLPPHELLSEIKSRLNEDVFQGVDALTNRIAAESKGQATPYAKAILQQMQGIPTGINPTRIPSVVRSLSSLLGTSMTPLRAFVHAAQTLWQTAPDGGVVNYLHAMSDVLRDHKNVKEGLKLLGVPLDTVRSWGFEKALSTQNLGRFMNLTGGLESAAGTARKLTNKFMGIDLIINANNVIAGETYRRFAKNLMNREVYTKDSWITGTKKGEIRLSSSDIGTLKGLGVSQPEINEVQKGGMSQTTFAKIVQNGVERLGSNLSNFKKGRLETSPIGRMVFNYSSYAINSGRIISSFFNDRIKPALAEVKKGNPRPLMAATIDLTKFVGAAWGAGALTSMLYNMPRGAEMRDLMKKEDESTLEKAWGAMMKIAFVGPAARFIESMDYSGPTNWVVGMMPQLNSVGQLIGMMSSKIHNAIFDKPIESRYAKFSASRQMGEFIKSNNPLIRSFGDAMDKAEYPSRVDYDETRGASQQYKRNHKDVVSTGTADEALDPMKEQVLFFVERGDARNAMSAAQDYYKGYIEKMSKDPRAAAIQGMSPEAAATSLRQSLETRAPIDLKELEKLDFLGGLPADRVRKYYKTDLIYRSLVDSVAPKQER